MADALVSLRSLLDGTMVIDVRGELDIAVNDSLRDVLVHTITTLRPPCVVVNLRHVSFVDSTGISALLAGYNAAREVGIRYEVRDMPPFVEKQLRATGVYDLVSPQS